MARMAEQFNFFRVEERTAVIRFKEFRLQTKAIPVQATGEGEGINRTPHCAHVPRATHAIFHVVCTWLKIVGCSLCGSLKSLHLIHVSPHLA